MMDFDDLDLNSSTYEEDLETILSNLRKESPISRKSIMELWRYLRDSNNL